MPEASADGAVYELRAFAPALICERRVDLRVIERKRQCLLRRGQLLLFLRACASNVSVLAVRLGRHAVPHACRKIHVIIVIIAAFR